MTEGNIMAKNIQINGASYNAVPYIKCPLAGTTGDALFYETSDATATAASILSGYSAYTAGGKVNGTATTPTITQDGTTKALTIS